MHMYLSINSHTIVFYEGRCFARWFFETYKAERDLERSLCVSDYLISHISIVQNKDSRFEVYLGFVQ